MGWDFLIGGIIDEKRFINIIYYNEDPENLNDVIDEINYFEEQTTGAFIYCNSIDKLDIILDEINNCYDYNYNKYNFELIVSGKNYDKSMTKISNKDYERYFNHICIFDKEGYKTKEDVLQKFIKKIKSKKIKPYPINKLVTYEEYKNKVKYFCGHLLISAFYGKLDKELYINNKNKIKELIYKDENNKKEEDKKDKNNKKEDKKDVIFKSFDKFDIDTMNEEIIKEYTNHTFYGDLNRWLREINIFSFDQVAYFTSRLMLSLNQYGEKENKYYKDEKVVYRGMNLDYISLLNYERAKNKIIILTSFTSTTEKKSISDNFAKKYSNDKI